MSDWRLDISKAEILAAAADLIDAQRAGGEDGEDAANARWDAMKAAEARFDQALARRDARVAGK